MNLNLVKSAVDCMKSLYLGTIPHCLTPWNWVLISLFFFFSDTDTNSPPPEDTPTRLSKYLASPFLAIVEPEWNFDLSYILREENDFSLRLWEKYSFSLSHVLMFFLYGIHWRILKYLWKLTYTTRGPAFEHI